MRKTSRIALILATVAVGVIALGQTAFASLIYAEVPVPGTPCAFVVEGDADTRVIPPAWAHAGFACTG